MRLSRVALLCVIAQALTGCGLKPSPVGPSSELLSPLNVAGDYTLTFVVGSACASFPNEMRTRTYAATIPPTPANTYFNVTLSGASFLDKYDSIAMDVAGRDIGFWMEPLVEQIAPDTFLVFNLSAVASLVPSAASTISAPAEGTVDYCVVTSAAAGFNDCYQGQAAHLQCQSNDHRLILTRR